MSEWQPIETAPKDGTAVVLYGKGLLRSGYEQAVGVYIPIHGEDDDSTIRWWHVEDGKFGPYAIRGPSPTHWMPLPPPPEEQL